VEELDTTCQNFFPTTVAGNGQLGFASGLCICVIINQQGEKG